MSLISVHIAVKDSASTLERAVTSVLTSLPRDAEVFILDDASSDSPDAALSSISDSRVIMYRNEVSRGIGAARQQMLESTDSEFVATMDADDISLPSRFSRQLRALQVSDFVFSSIIGIWEGSRRLRPGLPLAITAEAMPLHLLVHNLLCNPTMAARRSAVVESGGYRAVRAEDHDLWLRALARRFRFERLGLPVLAYRHHDRQTSTQPGWIERALDEAALRQAYIEFVFSRFGVEPTWLDALWSTEWGSESFRQSLKPLDALLADQSRSLSPVQRFILSRTTRHLEARK